VQDLMRHTCPNCDVGVVFERAPTMLLEHLERTKSAQVSRPRQPRGATAGSRHIPAVRRAVWQRDEGQCAFTGTRGRCTERGFLEFHHILPFADGARPQLRTFSSDVERTISTNRSNGSALGIQRSCGGAAGALGTCRSPFILNGRSDHGAAAEGANVVILPPQ
jgi:5-methylcytosine-specific restriction endonuclease McrA